MAAPPTLLDDGQPSSGSPLSIGQVVCGKYRIERQIGRGGMGIVLAATHLQLGNLVALKVMRRDLLPDDRALDRLLMEARAAARVRSEHVARVLDVGMLEGGSPFIVMEYLEGENLADLLDREGALSVEQAAWFMMQCCLALAEVHVAGMVHRDLKPGNIFIARPLDGLPTVKIVDFGISKHIGEARERGATTSPQVLGSPFYMSPEQMRAEGVDGRSDIWGLGAILFEMLTGRPPFLGETLPEVYSAVLNVAPPPVDSLRPGLAPELDDVVQRCLEKQPARRYGDVAQLAEALAPFAGPLAAQAVERISRILSSPEAARARPSLLPGAGAARSSDERGGERLSLQPSIMLSVGPLGEASMGSDPEQGRRPSEPGAANPAAFDPAGISPGTLLESSRLEGVPRHSPSPYNPSWPSSSANTGELAPLAATGARVRALRANRGRGVLVALAVCVAGLATAAVLWPRRVPPEPAVPQDLVVEPAARAPAEAAPAATGEPPIAEAANGAPPRVLPLEPGSSAAAAGDRAAPVVETHALRPLPRAKPAAPRAAPPPRPHGTDPSSALWDEPAAPTTRAPENAVKRPEPASAGGPSSDSPSAARRPLATPDDAWNPDAFGERR